MTIAVEPVTPKRWDDLERLFGPNGAYSGCWCMWFRQTSAEFSANAGAKKRTQLKELVEKRRVPGLIAYVDGEPAGWVSVAPRREFGRIERSPVVGPIDDRPSWSIVCLYVAHAHRKKGVSRALVAGAVEYARSKGAEVVEGYPIDLTKTTRKIPAAELYVGTAELFRKAGFEVAKRRKDARPVMRLYL